MDDLEKAVSEASQVTTNDLRLAARACSDDAPEAAVAQLLAEQRGLVVRQMLTALHTMAQGKKA